MHSSLDGVDAIGKGVQPVGVEPGVPLEGDFHLLVGFLVGEVSDLGKQRFLRGVDVFNEVADAPFVPVNNLGRGTSGSFPLVTETDLQPPVEECHHLEFFQQRLGPEAGLVEDLWVGPESHAGTGPPRGGVAHLVKSGDQSAPGGEVHEVAPSISVDLHLHPG